MKALSEDELDILDACLSNCGEINETESSTLYYIYGYVSFKEKLCCDQPAELPHCSEFDMVSRGKLCHPPIQVYVLSKCLYSYYKKVDKSCPTKLMVTSKVIYEYMDIEYDNLAGILRPFIKTFSKAFAKKETRLSGGSLLT